jgi:hypothetical protein
MTRRNDKRNNRHNRQRNNETEFSSFVQMIIGALLGKGTEMIAKKMAEEAKKTPDIHAEGINNEDINNGNATLSKLRIPADGSAVEYTTPDNFQFFFSKDGRLMVRKKIEGEAETPDDKEDKHITYDDVLKELYYGKTAYWVGGTRILYAITNENSYNDINNCASEAQCKRMVAFNKLQNIAKYLNKGWKPKFDGETVNWCICYKTREYVPKATSYLNDANVFFSSMGVTIEAIRIMGEESLNDLFNEDW